MGRNRNLAEVPISRGVGLAHRLAAVGVAVIVAGCGGGRARPAAVQMPPASVSAVASTHAPPPAVAGAGVLRRSAVRSAVRQGVGAFLQHVELDDQPVFVGGRFHGFRIAALHDAAFWAGVDLKPGDVVTGVNGFPIERPDDAERALDSLQVASELRVAYERDGHRREIVFTISDDR